MKKALVLALTVGLVAGAMSVPAVAKKKAKPVATTFFLHGNMPVGDGLETASNLTDGTIMRMDGNEPTEAYPKSMSYSLPVGNAACTGNPLFPSWEGRLAGKIVGDVKFMANFASAPGTAIARIWTDVPFSSCTSGTAGTEAFVDPLAEVEVEVPPGQNEVEIVFEDINVKVLSNMIVELHQSAPTSQGRVLYDSPDFASRVEFRCVPASGKSCLTQ